MCSFLKPQNNTAVINAEKNITLDNMRDLRMEIGNAFESEQKKIIIDFTNTKHFHYLIANMLNAYNKLIRQEGGKLILSGLSTYLFNIFSLYGEIENFSYTKHPETDTDSFFGATELTYCLNN